MIDKRALTGFACGVTICFLLGFFIIKEKKKESLLYNAAIEAKHQQYIRKLPDEISFAGEKVHFKTPASYQRYSRELKYNTRKNSSTRLLLRHVRIWLPEIEHIIRKHQLPDDFKFLAVAESNLTNAVSHKQAAGFWQLTATTAKELGLKINNEVDERYHPLVATDAACRYLKRAYKVFGDWTSAAASYNRGIAGVVRAYESQQVDNFYDLELNDETSRYLYKILAMKDLITNPDSYGFNIYWTPNSYIKKIEVDTTITNLVKFCKKLNLPYLTLKQYNPWLLQNSLTVEEGEKYTILIPFDEIGIADPAKRKLEKLKKEEQEKAGSTVPDSLVAEAKIADKLIF